MRRNGENADAQEFDASAELVKWRRWAMRLLGCSEAYQDDDEELRNQINTAQESMLSIEELRLALQDVPPGGASGNAPAWIIRLHRAACEAAGIGVRDRATVVIAPEVPSGYTPGGSYEVKWPPDVARLLDMVHSNAMVIRAMLGLQPSERASAPVGASVLAILRSPEGRAAIRLASADPRIGKLCRLRNWNNRVARVVAIEPGGALRTREDDWTPLYADYRADPEDVEWIEELTPPIDPYASTRPLRPGDTWRDPEGTEYDVIRAEEVYGRPRWLVGSLTTPEHLRFGLRSRADLHMKPAAHHPYVLVERTP